MLEVYGGKEEMRLLFIAARDGGEEGERDQHAGAAGWLFNGHRTRGRPRNFGRWALYLPFLGSLQRGALIGLWIG